MSSGPENPKKQERKCQRADHAPSSHMSSWQWFWIRFEIEILDGTEFQNFKLTRKSWNLSVTSWWGGFNRAQLRRAGGQSGCPYPLWIETRKAWWRNSTFAVDRPSSELVDAAQHWRSLCRIIVNWQELFSAKRIICCTPKCSGPNMMKYFSKNLESQSGEVNVLIHVFSQTNECLVRVGSWRKKKKLSWKILFKSCYEIF